MLEMGRNRRRSRIDAKAMETNTNSIQYEILPGGLRKMSGATEKMRAESLDIRAHFSAPAQTYPAYALCTTI